MTTQTTTHVSVLTLGVEDLERSKRFYTEGLGRPILEDHGAFVTLGLGDAPFALALYKRDALARDAGVASAEGSGFRGIHLSYAVETAEQVDAVLANALEAGGTTNKPAKSAVWGGYSGVVADPDGHVWKIVSTDKPSRLRRNRSTSPAQAPAHPSATHITLGVGDMKRTKQFYETVGFPVRKAFGNKFVSLALSDGPSNLGLYTWDGLAKDAGVDPAGSGFRGFTFSHVAESADEVDAVLDAAVQAGATIAQPAEPAAWGGYSAYFTDPDGVLWKVAAP